MLKNHLSSAFALAAFFFSVQLTAQLATPIEYGQSIIGNLPSTSSTASFTTPFAQPGDVFVVRAAPPGLMKLKLELYSPSGQFLMSYFANDDYIIHFFYAIPLTGESGLYKLIVSSTDGFFTGDFCLFLHRANETPNPIALNCNTSQSDDLDCISSCMALRYMVQQGAVSRIKIDANSLSTPEAWLCASDGTILRHGVSTSGYTLTFDSLVANYTGCYQLFVTDFGAFLTNGFNVSHTLISGNCAAPSIQSVPANGNVCTNSPFSITATSPLSGTTYSWSGPNGFTSTQAQISFPAAADSLSGIYTVTITTPGVCPNVVSRTITVKPLPSATATVTPASGIVCAGKNFSLNVITNAGGSIYYQWSGPNFNSSSKSPTLYNVTSSQSGVYKISVTDGNGCLGADSIQVNVRALPTVAITQPAGAGVCQGNTLQLYTQTNASPATFSWSGPNAFSSTLQNPQIPNTTSANTGTYNVMVTDSFGCVNDTYKYLTIWARPVATITPAAPAVCSGDSVKLTAGGGSQYKWSTGAIVKEIYVKPLQTKVYSITATDSNGCSDTESATVTVNPKPSIAANSVPPIPEICSGQGQILLSVMSADAINPVWKWTKNGSFFSNNQFISLSNPAQSGIFLASVTDGITGCSNTALPITVKIFQTPSASILPVPAPPYTTGDNFILCANSNASVPEYQWAGPNGFTNDSACVSVNNAGLVNAGTYSVTVTDVNGCKALANISVSITVGTVQPAEAWGISVAPNPGRDLVYIRTDKPLADRLQIVLFDANGRLIRDFWMETPIFTLDLSKLATGLYTLRISDGEKTGALRLAIVR